MKVKTGRMADFRKGMGILWNELTAWLDDCKIHNFSMWNVESMIFGYYETDDWTEGQDKYFRGYCIDLLSNLHKPYNERLRKELEKIKAKTFTK